MPDVPEAFVPLNSGNSAPVTGAAVVKGGRRHKLKLVTRKQARKLLKKMGKKMRGGAGGDLVAAVSGTKPDESTGTGTGEGGRRRRHTKKTHRRSRVFGIRMPY